MPGIQDIYSVNVSNRYDIGAGSEPEEEDDSLADYDPFDQLKTLEDQKKQALEDAKKKKQALATKNKNQKKPTRFQENKDANVPAKKEGVAPKSTKPPRQNERNDENRSNRPNSNRQRPPRQERQNYGEGDENRRPPRRRNNEHPPSAKNEGGVEHSKGDQSFGRPAGDYGGPRRDRAERYRGGRGGYRGGGGGGYQGRNYGGYRNDGRDDRGKREFDRRSGSDRSSVKPSDKRDGAGPRNWGTPGNEIEEATEVIAAAPEAVGNWQAESAETETKETPKTEETTNEDEKVEDKPPKEEEPAEMTLDEWKAKQDNQSKPSFNIRKAGEGENSDQWKNMKVLKKVKPDNKPEPTAEDQHKRQSKQQVNVNIQFGESRGFGGRGRGRGERGSRGRGRGGRYGGDRSQRSGHQSLPDVQNEQEFPTLG